VRKINQALADDDRNREQRSAEMKRYLPIFLLAFVFVAGVPVHARQTPRWSAQRRARRCRSISNDGFKIRDGHWCGMVKSHDHALVAVNLYAGNQYWFSAAGTEPVKKIAVTSMMRAATGDYGELRRRGESRGWIFTGEQRSVLYFG